MNLKDKAKFHLRVEWLDGTVSHTVDFPPSKAQARARKWRDVALVKSVTVQPSLTLTPEQRT